VSAAGNDRNRLTLIADVSKTCYAPMALLFSSEHGCALQLPALVKLVVISIISTCVSVHINYGYATTLCNDITSCWCAFCARQPHMLTREREHLYSGRQRGVNRCTYPAYNSSDPDEVASAKRNTKQRSSSAADVISVYHIVCIGTRHERYNGERSGAQPWSASSGQHIGVRMCSEDEGFVSCAQRRARTVVVEREELWWSEKEWESAWETRELYACDEHELREARVGSRRGHG
jgi:hypothetical protein